MGLTVTFIYVELTATPDELLVLRKALTVGVMLAVEVTTVRDVEVVEAVVVVAILTR